ncbi:hypothetical protein [Bradyrhizobium sp. BR13661]|jgi:hypothetical protein|uniref:hypothetical protein n=1 Tax=Bradyrhizobium sp. BR13661 TaxID=2940622 RepID=UPI0024742EA2|nr:hypothetical protein [Bradyrhizobium sp. BR13661]MDH6264271.1 hypothetical protein [Bradyrhizobium sp. BR13661]
MLPIIVWMTEIPFPGHYSVIVTRVPKGTAPSRPAATRLMAAAMTKVSLERLMCHVAIIDGELTARSAVYGETPEVEWFVATKFDELTRRKWLQIEL